MRHACVLQAICDVSLAQVSDVDRAVAAAKEAFEEGEWGKMNPRDRGRLIYRSVFLQLLTLSNGIILEMHHSARQEMEVAGFLCDMH